MLDSLREFSTVEAIGLLSRVGSTFTPADPFENNETEVEPISLQGENVLAEIRQQLSIDPKDNSDKARDKILFFISDQLSRIALEGTDEGAIKARLADRGLLRPNLYEIKFHPKSARVLKRGIRSNHIRQALNYPDDAEHIELDSAIFSDQGSASFYVKHHFNENDASRNFSLLVVTNRKGYTQMVSDAMRIYPADVNLANVSRPLDLLRVFIQKYGSMVEFYGHREKLFLLASIDKPRIIHDELPIKVEPPEPNSSLNSFLASLEETIEIAIAYAIDENRYRADLVKRGVHLG